MQRSSLVTLRRIKDGGKLKRCVLKFSLGTRYSVALREKEKKREREKVEVSSSASKDPRCNGFSHERSEVCRITHASPNFRQIFGRGLERNAQLFLACSQAYCVRVTSHLIVCTHRIGSRRV